MQTSIKVVGILLLMTIGVFGCSLLMSGLGIINIPFFNLSKKVELNYGVIDKIYDTDYCLSNYEFFKTTAEGIKGMDEKINNQQLALDDFEKSAGERSAWTFEDKGQYNELSSRVVALKNLKVSMINEYNSKSQMLNRVACKNLPLFFSL
jgi:hypothetical protein